MSSHAERWDMSKSHDRYFKHLQELNDFKENYPELWNDFCKENGWDGGTHSVCDD